MEKWKTISSEVAFDNEWCKVEKEVAELPSGKIIDDYFINIKHDVVLVLPVTADGKAIMVRQYKHGVKEILLEFPGGIFDPAGEEPLIAAQRELREETGYSSDSFEELSMVYNDPTKDSNGMYLFLARNVVKAHDTEFDVTEDIETLEIALEEIPRMIKTREIRVTGSVAIYYMALAVLHS